MKETLEQVVIYTDGASRGNPGLASIGVYVMLPDGRKVEACGFIGKRSNNYAEYQAVIYALFMAKQRGWKNILIRSDSLLVVNQVKNIWQIKSLELLKLYDKIQYYLAGVGSEPPFESFHIVHIPREQNTEADRLANKALDQAIDDGLNAEPAFV